MFSVNLGQTIAKEPSRLSTNALNRLMAKPSHKTDRIKFDHNNKLSLEEKMNTAKTAEDTVDGDDNLFKNSLRPLDPTLSKAALSNQRTSQKADDTELKDKKNRLDYGVPPGFFEDDMRKWNEKFKTSQVER